MWDRGLALPPAPFTVPRLGSFKSIPGPAHAERAGPFLGLRCPCCATEGWKCRGGAGPIPGMCEVRERKRGRKTCSSCRPHLKVHEALTQLLCLRTHAAHAPSPCWLGAHRALYAQYGESNCRVMSQFRQAPHARSTQFKPLGLSAPCRPSVVFMGLLRTGGTRLERCPAV